MRAAVYVNVKQIKLSEITAPGVPPDGGVLTVEGPSVCLGDYDLFSGRNPIIPARFLARKSSAGCRIWERLRRIVLKGVIDSRVLVDERSHLPKRKR
jgi:hypothetical protein